MSGVHYMNIRKAQPGDIIAAVCGEKPMHEHSFAYSNKPEEITCGACRLALGKNASPLDVAKAITVSRFSGFFSDGTFHGTMLRAMYRGNSDFDEALIYFLEQYEQAKETCEE